MRNWRFFVAASSNKKATAKKSTAKKTTAKKQTTRSTAAKRSAATREQDGLIRNEVIVLLAITANVILFLSNLHLCGAVGEFLHEIMVGMFGILGYVFPVYLFLCAIMYVMRRGEFRTYVKLAVSFVILVLICGLVELTTMDYMDVTLTLMDYYEAAQTKMNGGLFGGMMVKLLYPAVGLVGSYVVMMVLTAIGLVITTEKSILDPIKTGGKKVYDSARDDAERRRVIRQEREEEERRMRASQKVSGVAMDTKIGKKAGATETAEQTTGPKPRKVPVVPERPVEVLKGQIHGIDSGYRTTTAEQTRAAAQAERQAKEQAAQEARMAQEQTARDQQSGPRVMHTVGGGTAKKMEAAQTEEMPKRTPSILNIPISKAGASTLPEREEALTLDKDYRTLSELESLDELHSSFRKESGHGDEAPLRWNFREGRLEDAKSAEIPIEKPIRVVAEDPEQLRMATGEVPADQEEIWGEPEMPEDEPEMPWGAPEDEIPTWSVERGGENHAKPAARRSEPVIAATRSADEYEKEDYRTVTTGNGKCIEADIDPKEDPLTAKRLENQKRREASQAAEQGGQGSIWSSGAEKSSSGGHSFTQSITPKAEQARATAAREGARPTSQPTNIVENQSPKKKKLKPYERPPIKLLSLPAKRSAGMSDQDLRETAALLQETLQTFGVGVTVTNISCGPTVTRYELKPEMGVKVSKIVSLTDDIKLSLAAADIRIEAPIPGKAAVGIEVPNKENQKVLLREVLESPEFIKHPSKLAFALGRDIGGQCIVADLARMPHLLIAGATGSGKSVCINTLIVSILYKALPSEVELIMIDPKVVELSAYNGIPHLKIPVVTDAKKAAAALNWAVQEMNNRYKKFADYNVRSLKAYNDKIKAEIEAGETEEKVMPQLVIIVDELADLMMVAPGEVEDAICRLAQMARAAGIYLVLATQRPSVDVITGLIKANIPSRIAFAVSSGVDSRTIIDMNGAEKLLGKGDMLYFPQGTSKPTRVQGALVEDSEVEAIVAFMAERDRDDSDGQVRDLSLETMLSSGAENGDVFGEDGASDWDAYFGDAGRFVIEKQKASIGMLQRMFKIGWNRAARIVDQLEAAGVVGPEEGTKARKVLMSPSEFEELLRNS